MSATSSDSFDLQLTHPKSAEHARAAHWLGSLVRVSTDGLKKSDEFGTDEIQVSLTHSLRLHGLFAQTGDERYLAMSEDFLRQSLSSER